MHKLAYFKKAGWEPDWIETAHEIVRNEYNRSYAKPAARNHSDEDSLNDQLQKSHGSNVRVFPFPFAIHVLMSSFRKWKIYSIISPLLYSCRLQSHEMS